MCRWAVIPRKATKQGDFFTCPTKKSAKKMVSLKSARRSKSIPGGRSEKATAKECQKTQRKKRKLALQAASMWRLAPSVPDPEVVWRRSMGPARAASAGTRSSESNLVLSGWENGFSPRLAPPTPNLQLVVGPVILPVSTGDGSGR